MNKLTAHQRVILKKLIKKGKISFIVKKGLAKT